MGSRPPPLWPAADTPLVLATLAALTPGGPAVNRAGTLFVADTGSRPVRRISAAGIVTTLGGATGTSAVPVSNLQ